MIAIDRDWLGTNPLPRHDHDTDKNDRGRVLVVGGSSFVPGALRLTGEAALRAGAGKLQLATVREVAVQMGVLVPEAAMIALPGDDDGEIATGAADRLKDSAKLADCLILGPGMRESDGCPLLVSALLDMQPPEAATVLDAAAIGACRNLHEALHARAARLVLTPHLGEMAALTGREASWINDNSEAVARETAAEFKAILVLKGPQTIIAGPDGTLLFYEGGGPGLATGGSGDVLAGIMGGLLARGADPMLAAAWAVWVHGRAGRTLTARYGGPGLLARELVDLVPELLHQA